jgi:hypothetical protein
MTRSVPLLLLSISIASSACNDAADDTGRDDRDITSASSCPVDYDDRCLRGELVDGSLEPGLQPECAVSGFLRADDSPLEYVLPPCKVTGNAVPCFEAVLDREICPETTTGLRIDVRHDWGDDVVDIDVECVRPRPRP